MAKRKRRLRGIPKRPSRSAKFSLAILEKEFPTAYKRLLSSYRNDNVLEFRTTNVGTLLATPKQTEIEAGAFFANDSWIWHKGKWRRGGVVSGH